MGYGVNNPVWRNLMSEAKYFYYRFRPFTELTVKELIYDEIFFASTEECNDPYEGFPFIEFPRDADKWRRLLNFAWDEAFSKKYTDLFVEYFCKHGNINLNDLKKMDFYSLNKDVTMSGLVSFKFHMQKLHSCIENYTFQKKYFVSFSKSCMDYLMWSHYADKHNGICLIFKPINNGLFQRKDVLRTEFSFESVRSSIANPFIFQDVVYCKHPQTLDGFDSFPADICKRYSFESEEERINFVESREKYFHEKLDCWDYEKEVRLLLSAPSAWINGKIELSKYQRLFHYEPTQLAGIIFGSRTSEKNKKRIIEIVNDKQDVIVRNGNAQEKPNIFMFFQASMGNTERKLDFKPIGVNVAGSYLDLNAKSFDGLLKRWGSLQ